MKYLIVLSFAAILPAQIVLGDRHELAAAAV